MNTTSFYATGRRKRAIARVWLYEGEKGFTINGREVKTYLHQDNLKTVAERPLTVVKLTDHFRVRVNVTGGGLAGQADAIRLGIARALLKHNEKLRPTLRQEGHLTRDPREKERKKYGRKGARRSFQYTKR